MGRPHILFHEKKQKTSRQADRKTKTGETEGNHCGIAETSERFHAGRIHCDSDGKGGCFCGELQGNPGIFAGMYRPAGEDVPDQHKREADDY